MLKSQGFTMAHGPGWDLEDRSLEDLSKNSLQKMQLLLMQEILHHLGCKKTCKIWDKLRINWLAGFLNHQQYHSEDFAGYIFIRLHHYFLFIFNKFTKVYTSNFINRTCPMVDSKKNQPRTFLSRLQESDHPAVGRCCQF